MLEDFLGSEGLMERVKIEKIDDVYGVAISNDYEFDAIFVVEKTIDGIMILNKKRKDLGLESLNIILSPTEKSEDGQVISSSRIRSGEIDRNGNFYINKKWLKNNLILPESIRSDLKKPFGELIKKENLINLSEEIGIVGDATALTFNKLSIKQKISIIDFKINRKIRYSKISEIGFTENIHLVRVDNPAGKITPELFMAIIDAFKSNSSTVIEVSGEEDLSVLPLILAAPLGFNIFYGQPDEGLVRVIVDEETKKNANNLMEKFEIE